MNDIPTISYFTPIVLPWRQRPWNRWVKVAVPLTILSAGGSAILLMCSVYWLIRPSNVETIRLATLLILLATVAFNITALVSATRHRTTQRGFILAIMAFILTFPSCGLFTTLMGPASEVPQCRFDYATRENQWKIVRELQLYRETHDAYPPHLAVLLASGRLKPRDLLDPFSKTAPLTLSTSLTPAAWPTIVADVDRHSDIIYTAADYRGDDEAVILLYDKRVSERSGRLMNLQSGERFVTLADLPAVFAAHNATRARNGLPPQTLDVQPPIPVPASATTLR